MPLAERVIARARANHLTIGVAESVTGGMLASALTEVAGASEAFAGGIVAYTNDAKARLLDIDEPLIQNHGAVSSAVACAMAEAARKKTGAGWGVGLTGFAGPSGDAVGNVHIALAHPDGKVESHEWRMSGAREQVRADTVQQALELLLDRLTKP